MMALMMTAWLLLAQAEAVPDTPAETEHAAALEALDWLQGCWEGEGMGGTMLVNGTYQVNVTVLGEQDDFILGYQVFEQEQG